MEGEEGDKEIIHKLKQISAEVHTSQKELFN